MTVEMTIIITHDCRVFSASQRTFKLSSVAFPWFTQMTKEKNQKEEKNLLLQKWLRGACLWLNSVLQRSGKACLPCLPTWVKSYFVKCRNEEHSKWAFTADRGRLSVLFVCSVWCVSVHSSLCESGRCVTWHPGQCRSRSPGRAAGRCCP